MDQSCYETTYIHYGSGKREHGRGLSYDHGSGHGHRERGGTAAYETFSNTSEDESRGETYSVDMLDLDN